MSIGMGVAIVGYALLCAEYFKSPKKFTENVLGILNGTNPEARHLSEHTQLIREKTEQWSLLFTNLGLMKEKNGDWIKLKNEYDTECYRKFVFEISDTLLISSFQKQVDNIRSKSESNMIMKVSNLEIYSDKGNMVLLIRKDDMPLPKYKFVKSLQTQILLGLDLDDKPVFWDTKKDPHCGIFANTGAGKSRLLHGMICNILQNNKGCKLYLIDLKNGAAFKRYKDLSNVESFARNPKESCDTLAMFDEEFEKRQEILDKENYEDYNDYIRDKPRSNLKRCYLIIDEIADIFDDVKSRTKNNKVQGYDSALKLKEFARKVRYCGMHIICATQRSTQDFINPSFKSNLGCILGMKVLNEHNSKLILDREGLEKLPQSHVIGIVGSTEIYFRSFMLDDTTLNDLIGRIQVKSKHIKDEVLIDDNNVITLQEVSDNVYK